MNCKFTRISLKYTKGCTTDFTDIYIFRGKDFISSRFIRVGKDKKNCCVKLENPASSNQLVDSSWLI